MTRTQTTLLATVLLGLPGCAALPPDAGFADVKQAVNARTQAELRWSHDVRENSEVQDAVRQMLADGLSVNEAVQIALVNNRNLQAEYEKLGLSQADFVEAGLLANPVLGFSRKSGGSGAERETTVTQEFLGLVTLAARRKTAQAAFEASKLRVADAVLRLAAEVKTAYFAVEGDEQALELFRTAADATQAAAEFAERQRSAGTMHRLNQTMQQSFYAQTLLEVARTEAQIRADREKLNRLLGLWGQDTQWQLPRRLPDLPDKLPDGATLEATAVEMRFDLVARSREIEAIAQARDFNARYRLLSALGIGYTVTRGADGETLKGPQIEIGLPLFDRGQARLRRLDAELTRAEQQLYAAAVDLRSEVREARDRLVATHAEAKYVHDVLLPLQQTILNETLLRYNGMLVGVYDLLLAKQSQLNTARDYVRATRDFWLAYVEVERLVGGRLPDDYPRPAIAAATSAPSAAPTAEPKHSHGEQ